MPYITDTTIAILLICITIGTPQIPHMKLPLKFILAQLILAFIVQALGIFIDIQNHENTWLFNLYIPLEVWLTGLAAYFYIKKPTIKKSLLILLPINTIVWAIIIAKKGIDNIALGAIVAESILLTTAFIYVLIELLQAQTKDSYITRNSTFWIAISIVIYFGCNIPLFSFLQYLMDVDMNYARLLFRINLILCAVRYVITGYALYLARKERKQILQYE